jgi:hypothetical protein
MGGDVGWRLPIAAEGRLPISLGKAKHDHLVPCAALGGDAVWLLEHVPEEVTMSALSRALRTALGQRTCATLKSLAVSPAWGSLRRPYRHSGAGDENQYGAMVPDLSWMASRKASVGRT